MNESEFIYGKNFSKYKKLILGTKKTWKFLPSLEHWQTKKISISSERSESRNLMRSLRAFVSLTLKHVCFANFFVLSHLVLGMIVPNQGTII